MDIQEIRSRLDTLDDTILDAFLQRMALADEVAAYKKEHGLPLLDRTRERQILSEVMAKSGDNSRYAYQLFNTLMQLSKARQSERMQGNSKVRTLIKQGLQNGSDVFPRTGSIACQGVEGANSQVACDKLFPMGSILYVKSFEAVCEAVESGLCQYGVLPVENSSIGSVRAVYDLLHNRQLSIVRSTRLCIRHELLAAPGTKLADIKEIYSHEQAIGQCSGFLSSLSGVKIIPCANTAVAAQTVAASKIPGAAAISAHSCAELYGLETVSADIQDSDNNYTRFICISKKPQIFAGANRISLITDCANTPGALSEILSRLAALGINMSKIESCPVTGRNFEFIFFLDVDASVREPGVIPMLEDLERLCETFVFLGNYQEV